MRPSVGNLVAGSLRATRDLPRYFLAGDRLADALANTAIALRRWPETVIYHMALGRVPNYVNPRTYTEKIQWRKLIDRNPMLPLLCDKLAVKEIALQRSPGLAVPEVLWSGTEPAAIPFDDLEPPYVVKANNRSGAIVIVTDSDDLDRDAVRAACRQWMAKSAHRGVVYEWAYSRVESKLIIERFLRRDDGAAGPPADHKAFTFDGEPRYLYTRDTVTDTKVIRDSSGRPLPWDRWIGLPNKKIERFGQPEEPLEGFDQIMEAAARVGAGVDHLRADFYFVGGQVYMGEATLYVSSGHKTFFMRDAPIDAYAPDDVDRKLGDEWTLPAVRRRTVLWRGLVGRRRPAPPVPIA